MAVLKPKYSKERRTADEKARQDTLNSALKANADKRAEAESAREDKRAEMADKKAAAEAARASKIVSLQGKKSANRGITGGIVMKPAVMPSTLSPTTGITGGIKIKPIPTLSTINSSFLSFANPIMQKTKDAAVARTEAQNKAAQNQTTLSPSTGIAIKPAVMPSTIESQNIRTLAELKPSPPPLIQDPLLKGLFESNTKHMTEKPEDYKDYPPEAMELFNLMTGKTTQTLSATQPVAPSTAPNEAATVSGAPPEPILDSAKPKNDIPLPLIIGASAIVLLLLMRR